MTIRSLPDDQKGSLEGLGRLWSSALTVSEFAALAQTGFKPAGMVIGASVYRFGEQAVGSRNSYRPRYGIFGSRHMVTMGLKPQDASVQLSKAWSDVYQQPYYCKHVGSGHVPGINYEDEPFERAVVEAYELAREHLRDEAVRCGAHGVIAAAIDLRHSPLLGSSAPTSEIRLVGTALRAPGAGPIGRPFVSHLSGQEFAKLIGAGLVPVDTVIGMGAVRSYFGCAGSQEDPFMELEFAQRTDAIQRCRQKAINQLASSVDGREMEIVGARPLGPFGPEHVSEQLFEYSMVGTAVVRFEKARSFMPRVTIGLGPR
jgi:hypothetical protein